MAVLLNTSRFTKTSLVRTRNNKDTYGVMEGFDKLKSITGENYTFYTVDNSEYGRTDLLASKFYGNPHLEWVLVMANKPKNPMNWPSVGEVIIVPNPNFVRALF